MGGINDALFHLFLFGFVAGLACFGALLVRGRGLERATGAVFILWTMVSGFGWLGGVVPGMVELPELVSVTLQPAARLMIGWWLLHEMEHPA